MTEKFELELRINKVMFYNDETHFAIYSCTPMPNCQVGAKMVNNYGNFSLKGIAPKLQVGEKRKIKFEGKFTHDKHGDYYKIIEVEAEKLNTVTEQDTFLKTIISGKHFKILKKAYPSVLLVDYILEDKIDITKTKGIKEKTLQKIKESVKSKIGMSVLIAELSDMDLSSAKLSKIILHFGDIDLAIDSIKKNIYCLCDIPTFGFKTVDDIALKRGDNPTNLNRIIACFSYLIQQENSQGHTWTTQEYVLEEAYRLLNIDYNFITDAMDSLTQNPKFFKDEDRVAFKKHRKIERRIFENLKRIQERFTPMDITPEELYKRIHEVEKRQGFQFTDEQREVIIQSNSNGVMIVNGKAGVGKGAIIKGIVETYYDLDYATCALSGKASSVLIDRGVQSSTIHRMLGTNKETNGFLYHRDNKLPFDIIVVDELSMVDISLFSHVLDAIEDGSRLLLLGDSGQLPAIGAGDVLRDLLETDCFQSYELTKVHRQASLSGILSTANLVREGKQVAPYSSNHVQTVGELKDQVLVTFEDKTFIPKELLKVVALQKDKLQTVEDLLNFQVITPNRERGDLSVRNLNIEMQKILNPQDKKAIVRNGYSYKEGDKIIANGNSYNVPVYDTLAEVSELESYSKDTDYECLANIYNGTIGIVLGVNDYHKVLFVEFIGVEGVFFYTLEDLDKISLAYAISVHRSQGSSSKNVIFAMDYSSYMLLTKQLVYTALTRCSGKGLLLAEAKALYHAINTDASTRKTFLQEFIDYRQ